MSPQTFAKDKDSLLDYQIDWSRWLDGDTISSSTWTANGDIVIDSNSNTATTATVWLTGGVVGKNYRLTNHIITAAGRAEDRTITVKVRQR
jgi:hypothetical protein